MAVSFLAVVPGVLAAQAPPVEEQSTIRGELVRFADTSVDVSVYSRELDAIPRSLWSRIGTAGSVSFIGAGSPGANERVRVRLEEEVGAAGVRVVSDPAELAPVGVQVGPTNEIRLVWYGRAESEGVAILADARAVDELFSLRILIPNPAVTEEDWWGLQAALSQAGIRRVQILSGRP